MTTKKNPKPRNVGRDAETGQFIPVEEARRRKRTAIVETLPSPAQKPSTVRKSRKR